MVKVRHNNRFYIEKNGKYDIMGLRNGKPYHFQPKRELYKYCPLKSYSVEALTEHYFYLSNPERLNDRFDCSPQLVFYKSKNDLIDIIKTIYPRKRIDKDHLFLDGFGFDPVVCKYIYNKWGILSLSPKHDDILMWSHYAKNDGFCIKFNTKKLPQELIGPFPISYVNSRAWTNISSEQMSVIPLIQCFQKNRKWSYENEWRCIADIECYGSRKVIYSVDAIEGVYFGSSFVKEKEISYDENDNTILFIKNRKKRRILDFLIDNNIPMFFDVQMKLFEVVFDRWSCYKTNQEGKYLVQYN